MNSRLPQHEESWGVPADRRRATAPRIAVAAWQEDHRLFTPQGYEPGYAYPLLVWLADPAEPRGFDLGRTMRRVSLRNYVAVQPAWPATDSGAAVDDAVWRAIATVCDRVAIHPGRIFLVGHGNAGTAAFRLACRHPDAFAGVVSLGGLFPLDEGLFGRLADVRRLSMLLCCRRAAIRQAASHTDRTLRLFHAAGAALAMRIYPGRSGLARAALADVNRWIMDEVCGAPAAEPSLSAP